MKKDVPCPYGCGKLFGSMDSIIAYHSWCAKRYGKPPVTADTAPESPAPKADAPKGKKDTLAAIFAEAEAAGEKAATDVVPVPMHVVQRANPFDDHSQVIHAYEPVMDGVCGFAWVNLPGNSREARYAKERYKDGAHGLRTGKGYPSGLDIWVSGYGQSMTRKESFASAFAKVLRERTGVAAYMQSRMD